MASKVELPANYREGALLGRGGFGMVVRLQDADGKNLPFAMKKMDIADPQTAESAKNEVMIMTNISHRRIIAVHRAFLSFPQKQVCIIMDFAPGGSIGAVIRSSGAFSEAKTRRYTEQILEGLSYVHSKNIIHLDLKGDNILLFPDDNIKITDFGISVAHESFRKSLSGGYVETPIGTLMQSGIAGTLHFMAPEVILGAKYGKRADIWSLGCTIVEMLTRRPPWMGKEGDMFSDMVKQIGPAYSLPKGASPGASNFLKRCFTWDRLTRPTADQLMTDPFISQ